MTADVPLSVPKLDAPPVAAPGGPSAFVDRRCTHRYCEGKNAYRMIGGCYNCGTAPILGMFTEGHKHGSRSGSGRCPACGCEELYWDRLATADEIPLAFGAAP